jgi:hypothetical protein
MFIGHVLEKDQELPPLDFTTAHIILVTGDSPNACGHMLLYIRGVHTTGMYFHFGGPKLLDRPKYMNALEYFNYLKSFKKEELIRKEVSLTNPDGAKKRLLKLLRGDWLTFVFGHNCGTFVKSVIEHGGNFWAFKEYCPVIGMGLKAYIEQRNFK